MSRGGPIYRARSKLKAVNARMEEEALFVQAFWWLPTQY